MALTIDIINTTLQQGNYLYATLLHDEFLTLEYNSNVDFECEANCKTSELYNVTESLQYRVTRSLLDQTTICLYERLLRLLGTSNFTTSFSPTYIPPTEVIIIPSGSYSTFLSLLDTPDTYLGQVGRIPVVNSDETGLVFTDFPTIPPQIYKGSQSSITTTEPFDAVFVNSYIGVASANQEITSGLKPAINTTRVAFSQTNSSSNLSNWNNWNTSTQQWTTSGILDLELLMTISRNTNFITFPLFSLPIIPGANQLGTWIEFTISPQSLSPADQPWLYKYRWEYKDITIPLGWTELVSERAIASTITDTLGSIWKLHIDFALFNNSSIEFRIRQELISGSLHSDHPLVLIADFNKSDRRQFTNQSPTPSLYWSILNGSTDPNTILANWNGTDTSTIPVASGYVSSIDDNLYDSAGVAFLKSAGIITYTFDNGLTLDGSGTNAQLGGALLQDTIIDGISGGVSTYKLDLLNMGRFKADTGIASININSSFATLAVTGASNDSAFSLLRDGSSFSFGTFRGSSTALITSRNGSFFARNSNFGFSVMDDDTFVGLYYPLFASASGPDAAKYNDYSINGISLAGDRWIPHYGATKAYADAKFASATVYFGAGTFSGAGTSGSPYILGTGIVGISNLSATGSPSSTTYLRGDNTWATVSAGGSGTVTSVSVVSANGFTGSVATSTTTPAITLTLQNATTSQSGQLTSTDWNTFNNKQGTITLTTTGTSGVSTFSAGTLNIPNYANTTYSAGTGLTLTSTTFSVNTSQNISTLSNLTGNGFVKTSGGTGALSIDTNTYLTANQTITLSGAVTGSGTTAITTTLASSIVGISNLSATGTPSSTTYLRGDNTWATVAAGVSGANPTASIGLSVVNGSASTFLRSDAAQALDVSISPTWTGTHTFNKAAIATTITDAQILNNGTASTSGATKQISPSQRFTAQVWNTTATAANNFTDFINYLDVTSAATPKGLLTWSSSLTTTSTPSYTTIMTLTNAGQLTLAKGGIAVSADGVNGFFPNSGAASSIQMSWGGTNGGQLGTAAGSKLTLGLSNITGIIWFAGLSVNTSPDVGLDRISTGLLEINDGTIGNNNGNIIFQKGTARSVSTGITTTLTDGFYIQNNTASTSGVPNQYSPNLHLGARVWNTTATAADNWGDWVNYVSTTSGTTPTHTLNWSSSLATTSTPSYTIRMSLSNTGVLNLTSLTASKVVFTDASKNLTSTGIGTSSQYIAGDGSLVTIGAKAHTIFTPSTGGTVALVNNQYNIINPTGTLATLTVNLPSSPSNNDTVYIKYTQAVTATTYGNGTVVDGITAPTAGGLVVLVYDSGTTSWY